MENDELFLKIQELEEKLEAVEGRLQSVVDVVREITLYPEKKSTFVPMS